MTINITAPFTMMVINITDHLTSFILTFRVVKMKSPKDKEKAFADSAPRFSQEMEDPESEEEEEGGRGLVGQPLLPGGVGRQGLKVRGRLG